MQHRAVDFETIRINGLPWCIQRLVARVEVSNKYVTLMTSGSADSLQTKKVVIDDLIVKDSNGVEHSVRLQDLDIICRQGHVMYFVWMARPGTVGGIVITSLYGMAEIDSPDMPHLALIGNRDTRYLHYTIDASLPFVTNILEAFGMGTLVAIIAAYVLIQVLSLEVGGSVAGVILMIGAVSAVAWKRHVERRDNEIRERDGSPKVTKTSFWASVVEELDGVNI